MKPTMKLDYDADKETLGLSGQYSREEWRGVIQPGSGNAGMDDETFRKLARKNEHRTERDRLSLFVLPEWFVKKDDDFKESDTEFFGSLTGQSAKAYNVEIEDGRGVWFPKSIARKHDAVGDIMPEDYEDDGYADEIEQAKEDATENLVVLDGVGPSTARSLGELGFSTLEEIADGGNVSLMQADGVGAKTAGRLISNAETLLADADDDAVSLAETLDISPQNAKKLIDAGLTTPSEIAETDKNLGTILGNHGSAQVIHDAAETLADGDGVEYIDDVNPPTPNADKSTGDEDEDEDEDDDEPIEMASTGALNAIEDEEAETERSFLSVRGSGTIHEQFEWIFNHPNDTTNDAGARRGPFDAIHVAFQSEPSVIAYLEALDGSEFTSLILEVHEGKEYVAHVTAEDDGKPIPRGTELLVQFRGNNQAVIRLPPDEGGDELAYVVGVK